MSDLSDLSPPSGATHSSKRRGRGPGSGSGKTAGRGHKGQKARSGAGKRAWFEGGQMPLQRRIPKRGFTSPFPTEYEIVNVGDFIRIDDDEITPEILDSHGLVDLGTGNPIKVLGDGELDRSVTVHAHKYSAGARKKIEDAGGTAEVLEDG